VSVGTHFCFIFATEKHHSTMSSRKEYGVDKRAQAAAPAQFYVECNKNPNTKLKIPAAMRAKGYSDDDASNRTLQAQVRRAAEKIETEQATASVTPPAPARASNSTSTRSNVPPACASVPAPAPLANMASAVDLNVDLGALPSPEKKTRRTSHQVQVERENKKKRASVHDLATSRATTLLSEERKKPKSEQRSARMICDQVEKEFQARKTKVTLSANTINRYVRVGDIGVGAKRRGYEGRLSKEAFQCLVLAFESFIQINQVNTNTFSNKQLMIIVNKVCDITSDKRIKETMLQRLLDATNVSLGVSIARAVEERRLLWTTYDNLSLWFEGWETFVLAYGFATLTSDKEVHFSLEQRRRIANIDETEISLDGSTSLAGGRPSVHFYDPNLPLASKPASKSSIKCGHLQCGHLQCPCLP
jgi:hypothetical protein